MVSGLIDIKVVLMLFKETLKLMGKMCEIGMAIYSQIFGCHCFQGSSKIYIILSSKSGEIILSRFLKLRMSKISFMSQCHFQKLIPIGINHLHEGSSVGINSSNQYLNGKNKHEKL